MQADAIMKRVSLRQVAAHLEIHESTVSRGLRDDPRISKKTRKLVRRTCQKLGYRPDSLLSEMGSARWQRDEVAKGNVIAYISCIRPELPLGDMPIFARKRASDLGYELEVFERSAFSSSTQLQRVLRNRGINQILLGPIFDPTLSVELDWDNFICVQLLPGFNSPPLHSVVRDHFNIVTLTWRKAVNHGYQRIGIALFDHPFALMDDVMRASAIYACQNRLFPALPSLPPFYYLVDDHREPQFVDWVQTNQPDVIIGFNLTHFFHHRKFFGCDIPYASLHVNASEGFSGVLHLNDTWATEGINLLHYCRRSYQWGVPKQRIDHVIEPIWFEGTTLPVKASA